MENKNFTEIITGASFLEKVGSFKVKVNKAGALFYTTPNAEYNQGYISKAAAALFKKAKESLPANATAEQKTEARNEALLMMSWANIHTEEGEVVPTLYPTPEEAEDYL